jgi:hypothetical protein
VQEKPGQLHIYLSLSSASSTSFAIVKEAVLESVRTTIAQYDCRPATTIIEQGLLPPAAGIKRRRVQRIP